MRRIIAVFGLLMIGVLAVFPPSGSTQDWTRKSDHSFRFSTAQTSQETGLPIEVELGPLVALCIVALSLVVALWFLVGSERKKPSEPVASPKLPSETVDIE